MLDNIWIKRTFFLVLAYIFYWISWQTAFAEVPLSVPLQEYVSKENLLLLTEQIKNSNDESVVIITINSNSGDLSAVLDAARKIYELKQQKHLKLVVYINDNAIGPAAVIPLLADELYVSQFASWGDISLANDKNLTSSMLRNQVISLVNPTSPHLALLKLMAAAMSDPAIRLIDDNGWRLGKEGEEQVYASLYPKGEALVVNHNQLNELGLIKQTLSLEQFTSLFHLPAASVTPIETQTGLQPISKNKIEEELKKHIVYSENSSNTIGHITIDDRTNGINQSTWLYVKSALEHYKKIKPIFIILELNTPGGEVFAAQQISDALKDIDTQFNIPVVAYINNWAISAGAMLAYSSRFIAAVKDASMGAAEPVVQGAEGKLETASEKVNSAIRADFANRARFFERNPLLAQAMVDKDMILVVRHGQITKLANESQIRLTGPDHDVLLSSKGKLLTLDAQQMLEYGVADLLVPPTKTPAITAEEQEAGKWPADKMALMRQPFFDHIPNASIDSFHMDWKMKFFALLASPAVSSLLFLGLMVGFYMEFSTPGFGLPGTIGLTCLFLIMLSSFSLEIASWLEVILLFTGLAVILIELFVLPTFGLLGIIGLIFFLMGLFGLMLPGIDSVAFDFDTKTWNAAGEAVLERLAWLSGTLVLATIVIALLARYVTPQLATFNRFVLKGNEQEGYLAVDNPSTLPKMGSYGIVEATLRPSGKVIVDNMLYDALSSGPFIEKGSHVIVTGNEGGALLVSPDASHDQQNKEIS